MRHALINESRPALETLSLARSGRIGHDIDSAADELNAFFRRDSCGLTPEELDTIGNMCHYEHRPVISEWCSVVFPTAAAATEGSFGWNFRGIKVAEYLLESASDRKLRRYFKRLVNHLQGETDPPRIEDPRIGYSSELKLVERVLAYVATGSDLLSSNARFELQRRRRDAARRAEFGVYNPILTFELPPEMPAYGRQFNEVGVFAADVMLVVANELEREGNNMAAANLRRIVDRWYPSPYVNIPVNAPGRESFVLRDLSPVLGYEPRFDVSEQVAGSVHIDHDHLGECRYSEDDIHEYRIVRERSPVYRGLPFERVKLVSDTHSHFATAVLADA